MGFRLAPKPTFTQFAAGSEGEKKKRGGIRLARRDIIYPISAYARKGEGKKEEMNGEASISLVLPASLVSTS